VQSTTLCATPEFEVRRVQCTSDHTGWSDTEPSPGWGLVLVQSGMFRVGVDGRDSLAEPTTAYLQAPGAELRFAHPRGGDVCTSVSVSPHWWQTTFAATSTGVGVSIPVNAELDLAHVMLLRAAAAADLDYAVVETLLTVLGRAVRATTSAPEDRRSASGALVRLAREAVLADDPAAATLTTLARHLHISAYHLSRMFTAHTGVGLTRYRNRVRVGRALHRLNDGEQNLAQLAADLGFADQAHLTRTITAHLGHTPTTVRHLLRTAHG
jgi:AraC-like DNA-binding protein